MAAIGKWRPYTSGAGPVAPAFVNTTTYVAGIPLNGKGNIYSPNSPKGVGYGSNTTVRPGVGNSGGGSKAGLKFM